MKENKLVSSRSVHEYKVLIVQDRLGFGLENTKRLHLKNLL